MNIRNLNLVASAIAIVAQAIALIVLLTTSVFAQVKPEKKTGKRIQVIVISTLAASALTKEKMPAYVPITGVGMFGVGMVIDLKKNKRKKHDNL